MDDLDPILARLGGLPLDGRLATIDAGVNARIDTLRERRSARRAIFSATSFALAIGMTGGFVAEQRAAGAPDITLSAISSLAPSTLLGGGSGE